MKTIKINKKLMYFDTLEKKEGVTVRDRDTGKQERVSENDLVSFLKEKLS